MGGPVSTIRNLINSKTLRSKDKVLALKYLNNGDIELLKDLVDSAYILSVKAKDNLEIPEEFKEIDIDMLDKLRMEVNDYYLLLGYNNSNDSDDYPDDISPVIHYDDIDYSNNDEQYFI